MRKEEKSKKKKKNILKQFYADEWLIIGGKSNCLPSVQSNHIYVVLRHGTKVRNYKQEDGNKKLYLNQEKQQWKNLWKVRRPQNTPRWKTSSPRVNHGLGLGRSRGLRWHLCSLPGLISDPSPFEQDSEEHNYGLQVFFTETKLPFTSGTMKTCLNFGQ